MVTRINIQIAQIGVHKVGRFADLVRSSFKTAAERHTPRHSAAAKCRNGAFRRISAAVLDARSGFRRAVLPPCSRQGASTDLRPAPHPIDIGADLIRGASGTLPPRSAPDRLCCGLCPPALPPCSRQGASGRGFYPAYGVLPCRFAAAKARPVNFRPVQHPID